MVHCQELGVSQLLSLVFTLSGFRENLAWDTFPLWISVLPLRKLEDLLSSSPRSLPTRDSRPLLSPNCSRPGRRKACRGLQAPESTQGFVSYWVVLCGHPPRCDLEDSVLFATGHTGIPERSCHWLARTRSELYREPFSVAMISRSQPSAWHYLCVLLKAKGVGFIQTLPHPIAIRNSYLAESFKPWRQFHKGWGIGVVWGARINQIIGSIHLIRFSCRIDCTHSCQVSGIKSNPNSPSLING